MLPLASVQRASSRPCCYAIRRGWSIKSLPFELKRSDIGPIADAAGAANWPKADGTREIGINNDYFLPFPKRDARVPACELKPLNRYYFANFESLHRFGSRCIGGARFGLC